MHTDFLCSPCLQASPPRPPITPGHCPVFPAYAKDQVPKGLLVNENQISLEEGGFVLGP